MMEGSSHEASSGVSFHIYKSILLTGRRILLSLVEIYI